MRDDDKGHDKAERQTRQIEHLILHAAGLPICRLSHDTQFHDQIMAGIKYSGGVPLLDSSPTRTAARSRPSDRALPAAGAGSSASASLD